MSQARLNQTQQLARVTGLTSLLLLLIFSIGCGGTTIIAPQSDTKTCMAVSGGVPGTQVANSSQDMPMTPWPDIATASFKYTGSLNTARYDATATFLNNGMVLVAGGVDSNGNVLASAELYDPSAGTFTPTGSLNVARSAQTATLLNNGKVLIAGGLDTHRYPLANTELYDPTSGTFKVTGSLKAERYLPTATLLNDGRVLVAGGVNCNLTSSSSAEVYDPATGTFAFTGNLRTGRTLHTATLLNNGTVLLVGGLAGTYSSPNVSATAELFDPAAGDFSAVGSLSTARYIHRATLLNGGDVLLAGGYDTTYNALASAELYSPQTAAFTPVGSMATARGLPTATLLNNGTVLVAGGLSVGNAITKAEIYNPSSATFGNTVDLNTGRFADTGTLLGNGKVLVAGGMEQSALASAELYNPGRFTPVGLVSIAVAPTSPSISVGSTQTFTATGTFSDSSTQTLSSVTWSSSDNTIAIITNDASNRGRSYGVAPGTVTISACTGAVCGSSTMTVVP